MFPLGLSLKLELCLYQEVVSLLTESFYHKIITSLEFRVKVTLLAFQCKFCQELIHRVLHGPMIKEKHKK